MSSWLKLWSVVVVSTALASNHLGAGFGKVYSSRPLRCFEPGLWLGSPPGPAQVALGALAAKAEA